MLKTESLGKFWQENSGDGSSFTRVRCISTGGQVTPHIYGSFKGVRAYSVPESCTKAMFKKKKSYPFAEPVIVDRHKPLVVEGRNGGIVDQNFSSTSNMVTPGLTDVELDAATAESMTRLLVCTLDTEQNERDDQSATSSDLERSHSRDGSVEMVTAQNTVTTATQSCRACGSNLELSDMVVVFDTDTFHINCFKCGQCRQLVDPSANFLVLDDGSPLCTDCSPECHSCGERIVCGHINVLNKDFHESCLKCSVCKKAFGPITKVYATGGEPCCAECVTPVFNEAWSSRASFKPLSSKLSRCSEEREGEGEEEEEERGKEEQARKESLVASATVQGSTTAASAGGNCSLPPRLESLSKAVNDLPDSRFHSLLRPSISVPSSLSDKCSNRMSLSSLKAIMYDELGVSLLMNFCMEESTIEYVVFWLDTEHFRHFDGTDDDIRIFAHHIMLKYIGYYAELPINLPKEVEERIVAGMLGPGVNQNLFSEAQEWVMNKMEREIQPKFLRSSDGQKYLEALVSRDITRRKKNREKESKALKCLTATVTSFDKRHFNTKYYVYEIQVQDGERTYMIYRRYSEFHSLHGALKCLFPGIKLMPLPKKIYFRRSQTRTVAQQRMKDLEAYLKGLMNLSTEVSQCDTLRRFLTQTQADKEDEAFNSRIRESIAIPQ